MKIISVLFTQNQGLFAKFLELAFGQDYNHVSLSIAQDKSEFYSFNFRGFTRETFEKLRQRKVHSSILYEFQVSEENYNKIKDQLETAKKRRRKSKYAFLGIFLCCIGIPFHLSDQYFCSEFVAGLLIASRAVFLQKRAASYLPEQLRKELEEHFENSCQRDIKHPADFSLYWNKLVDVV